MLHDEMLEGTVRGRISLRIESDQVLYLRAITKFISNYDISMDLAFALCHSCVIFQSDNHQPPRQAWSKKTIKNLKSNHGLSI